MTTPHAFILARVAWHETTKTTKAPAAPKSDGGSSKGGTS